MLIWLGKELKVVLLQLLFYCLLQNMYTRLVASTHRWQVLQKHSKGLPVKKALSDTRWSARHDAVRSVNKSYHENIAALEELATDENQPRDSRLEAEGFRKELDQLELAILFIIWDTILERFQKTNVSLQEPRVSFQPCIC